MPAGQEVLEFAQKAGAQVPREGTELYRMFRSIFRRSNYFFLDNKVLIIKISRKTKPFWGVGKKYLDLLDGRFEYFLVLLASSNEGWVFSETEVRRNIANDTWRLAKGRNHKIYVPLPDRNSFLLLSGFSRWWKGMGHDSGVLLLPDRDRRLNPA